MGDTGQVKVRLHSANDLLAVAQALEHEAAARYRDLSARMARQGDHELAAQFDALARMEDRHASQIAERSAVLLGRRPEPSRVKWETPPGYDEDEARGAELSAYQALAFAVRNEERAFAFFSYAAAEAENSEIRALAEDLAQDELHHAALLRQYRRRAFHEKRPAALEIPASVDELRALARRWDAEAAKAHGDLAASLADAQESEDAAIFLRLAEAEAESASGAIAGAAHKLRGVADGLRLLEDYFDRYARIAEQTRDESVVVEAQRLASQMVSRLASAGGGRKNALLDENAQT